MTKRIPRPPLRQLLASDPTSLEGMQLAQFGFFDPLANIAFALMFWAGLKNRYKVQLSAYQASNIPGSTLMRNRIEIRNTHNK